MSTGKLFEFEIVEGQRKGSSLLYVAEEKQLYRLKSKDRHARRYVCYNQKCKASAVVDIKHGDNPLCRLLQNDLHASHEKQDQIRAQLKLTSAIKNKCSNPVLDRTVLRETFNAECSRDEQTAKNLSFNKSQRTLSNMRSKSFPNDPKNSKDLSDLFANAEILENFGTSKYDTSARFYKGTIIEPSFSYTIFMSPTIAAKIADLTVKRYYLDIRVNVPKCGHDTFLVVHILIGETIFPFLYVMTSDRKAATYSHMFRHIEATGFKFNPNGFIYDKDGELEESLKTVFPNCLHGISWFHYCHSIRRIAKQIKNFPQTVRMNDHAKTMFQKFLALPLVSRNRMENALKCLRDEINTIENLPNDGEIFKMFIGCVQKQWLEKETSEFDTSTKAIRISHQLEDYNVRINRKFVQLNNSFFKSITILLEEDNRMSIKLAEYIIELEQEQPLRRKRPKDTCYRLGVATATLRIGDCSFSEFFNQIIKRKDDLQPVLDEHFNNADHDEDTIGYNDRLQDQPVLCVICINKQRSVVLGPCMHMKICMSCYFRIEKINGKTPCPICREIVTYVMKVFC